MSDNNLYDLTVVGGGPAGLFALFYSGLRQMKSKLIDGLDELGGQCMAMYPDKYIYDMPGYPRVKSKDMIAAMVAQAVQYNPAVVLGQQVQTLRRRDDGNWTLGLGDGSEHHTRTAIITAGRGRLSPKRLPNVETERWEGRGICYFVRDIERFRERNVLIVGGGDSAVDWALNIHPIATSVTL